MPTIKPALVLYLFLALLSVAPAHAASRYSENFNDGLAQGWSSSTTWSASAQYYRNDSEDFAAIATYGSDSWTTNYSLSAQLYSEYGSSSGATGNKVGLVFSYVDDTHYFRLLINTKGLVELVKVAGSTETMVGQYTIPSPSNAAVNAGHAYTVHVIVTNNKATVRVADQPVFNNLTISGLVAGRVGVISQYNHGRFDDVVVTNLLFKSGFEGPTIGAPENCSQGTCFRPITGTDTQTGFTWPLHLWDLEPGILQATTANMGSNAANIDEYVHDEIQQVTGPGGSSTHALYQGILKPANGYTWLPQNPHYIYKSGDPTAAQGDLYFRYWLKIGNASSLGSWRVLWQWKTRNDFRVNVGTSTYGKGVNPLCDSKPDGSAYWQVFADDEPAGAAIPTVLWEACQKTQPVPVGQWFKIEIYSQRGTPNGTDGRVWLAINGQTYIDVVGQPMWGVNTKKINRIMAPQLYTSAVADSMSGVRVEQWTDDYEIWDGFPADASPH